MKRFLIRVFDREKARQLALIEGSDFFDATWYAREYPDVAVDGESPPLHYLDFGARELRNPGPSFDTAWYVTAYPEVSDSGLNPLVHFLRDGKERGLKPARPRSHERWWEGVLAKQHPGPISVDAIARITKTDPPVLVIPVCDEKSDFVRCLALLRTANDFSARVLVLFDEDAVEGGRDLRKLAEDFPWLEVHENKGLSGAAGMIETAAGIAGTADLLVLDPDFAPLPGWMRRIRIAALREEKTGLAMAMGVECTQKKASTLGRAIAQASSRMSPIASGTIGPAAYMRRECLEEMRKIDVVGSSLCEVFAGIAHQAKRCGWACVVDDATLLAPVKKGGAEGFSPPADGELMREVERLIDVDPTVVLPRTLFVLSTRQGGTPQTNQDLMAALDGRVECFVLHSDTSAISFFFFDGEVLVELEKYILPVPMEALSHRSAVYDEIVASWLVGYAIELVHVRHIAWHGLGLIDMTKALGLPVVFSFHDFYTVCPTVKLLDEENVYCAGRCTATRGDCTAELWDSGSLHPLKNATVFDWRSRMGRALEKCDAFVTTSEHARNLMTENFPFLTGRDFRVIPHGRDFKAFGEIPEPVIPGEPMRLLLLGGISVAKGGRFLEVLAKAAPSENIEIHVLGTVAGDIVLPPHVRVHGPYLRDEVVEKIGAIRPHLGAILSIWPETFCHTLTELWAAGVPVVGFDIGAVGERIRSGGAGWLVEMSSSSILDLLRHLRAHPAELSEKSSQVMEWQRRNDQEGSCRAMSDKYFLLYKKLSPGFDVSSS